ncbi:MAG TPA: aspartate dehydrogenase domain-containing protein [Vineibacter sp.]|nr:aspartate dehydrogenase domain-containing protein [Vineibacter sp.]
MPGYGLIGFGRIGRRLAGLVPSPVVVLVRPAQVADAAEVVGREAVVTALDAFLARRPAIAIECASALALAAFGPALLASGTDLVPLSLTALVDPAFERRLTEAAQAGPGRIEIAPGAIGTLDLLSTAREERLHRVTYRQIKSPAMWQRTPAAGLLDLLAIGTRQVFYKGSVREVARHFPHNLNTSVGVALAGLGLDRTEAELIADPAVCETGHELDIDAGPGNVQLRLGGRREAPDGDPADYTAYSLARVLRRRLARVMI